MNDDQSPKERRWTETFETAESELMDLLKKLLHQGGIRRLVVRKVDGDVLIDVSLNTWVAVSAAAILMAPPLAVIGVIAGVIAKVKVEVVRVEDDV
jgi:hypothetical protein